MLSGRYQRVIAFVCIGLALLVSVQMPEELRPQHELASPQPQQLPVMNSVTPVPWDGPIWDKPVQMPFPNDALFKGYSRAHLEMRLGSVPTRNDHKIALVFFGLVKNVNSVLLKSFRTNVVEPLSELGTVHAYMHTFREANFSNPRNLENTTIDQQSSINFIRGLFSSHTFNVIVDETDDAHRFFGPTVWYLRNGGAWAGNSTLSTHYYLRQQFSLLRATEMWAGVNYTQLSGLLPLPRNKFSCVVYIRPDLLFVSALPKHVLRGICRTPNDGHRDVVVPSMEHGGWHDRSAMGTPEGMLLYGLRGLHIRKFVNAGEVPHAESYLARFLCENNVTIHIAPWATRRVRADGRVVDFPSAEHMKRYYNNQVRLWFEFTRTLHGSKKPHDPRMNCLARSIWSDS